MKDFTTDGSGAGSRPDTTITAALFDVIADWIEALHGRMPMQAAFDGLVRGLGAEAAILVRTHQSDLRPVRVLTCDLRARQAVCPLTSSFADGCFGPEIRHPRAGTVWIASSHAERPQAPLADWQASRRLGDFVVLALSSGSGTRDHIELHFRRTPSPALQAALGALLPTIARAWASRRAGLVTGLAAASHAGARSLTRPAVSAPILSALNPARLSRAEYRVSLLLSHGLSATGAAEELGLSAATVRSHLRSIYAKTGVASLAELVFLLVAPAQTPVANDRRSA